MLDSKRLAELRKESWKFHAMSAVEQYELLMAALAVVEAAQALVTHNAFTVGTKSCDALPQGILPRVEDLRESLTPFQKGEEELPNT